MNFLIISILFGSLNSSPLVSYFLYFFLVSKDQLENQKTFFESNFHQELPNHVCYTEIYIEIASKLKHELSINAKTHPRKNSVVRWNHGEIIFFFEKHLIKFLKFVNQIVHYYKIRARKSKNSVHSASSVNKT